MTAILETTLLQYQKSDFLIDLIETESGLKYVELVQLFPNKTTNTIKINPIALQEIIETLQDYHKKIEELNNPKLVKITAIMGDKIRTSYLKGVSIRDLAFQTGIEKEDIEKHLITHGIVIVPQIIETKPQEKHLYFKKKKKK